MDPYMIETVQKGVQRAIQNNNFGLQPIPINQNNQRVGLVNENKNSTKQQYPTQRINFNSPEAGDAKKLKVNNLENYHPPEKTTHDFVPKNHQHPNNPYNIKKLHKHTQPHHHILQNKKLEHNVIEPLESERHLHPNIDIIPVPNPPVPILQQNSCFYSCCPVECCRCRRLAYTCGGCCSQEPRMPGGGCCGCLGLSPSVGMNMPAPGMLPQTYEPLGLIGEGSSKRVCCKSCFGGCHLNGNSKCCGFCLFCEQCQSKKQNMNNTTSNNTFQMANFGVRNDNNLPPGSVYHNSGWLPAMGSSQCCCYCC